MKNFEVILPIKTISEANCSEHWTKKSKRHKEQKLIVWIAFKGHSPKRDLPCHIILTRYSPRRLDFDNLVSSFKWIRDQVSDYLIPGKRPGMSDDDPRLSFEYKQEKYRSFQIKIELIYLPS